MGKLVRDRIPEIIEKNGGASVTRILSDTEVVGALCDKVREEANELIAAVVTGAQTEIIGELADLEEVIRTIARKQGISWSIVENARLAKLTERGGFDEGIYLESWS